MIPFFIAAGQGRHGAERAGAAPGGGEGGMPPDGQENDGESGGRHVPPAEPSTKDLGGGVYMKGLAMLMIALGLLSGCGGRGEGAAYQQISQEEAREMMDSQEVIILDVREQDEYDGGHIPHAALLPVGSIDGDAAATVIPDRDAVVLVYCRSGNRSKTAAAALAALGYTNVYEFGGILTWPYETETGA